MIHAESFKTKVLPSSLFGADYTTNDDFCLKSPCKQTHHTSELELELELEQQKHCPHQANMKTKSIRIKMMTILTSSSSPPYNDGGW